MKYYKISESHLRDLLIRAHYYTALESGGVDSWEWFGESVRNYVNDCAAIDFQPYKDIEDIVDEDIKNCEKINSPSI